VCVCVCVMRGGGGIAHACSALDARRASPTLTYHRDDKRPRAKGHHLAWPSYFGGCSLCVCVHTAPRRAMAGSMNGGRRRAFNGGRCQSAEHGGLVLIPTSWAGACGRLRSDCPSQSPCQAGAKHLDWGEHAPRQDLGELARLTPSNLVSMTLFLSQEGREE